MADSLTQAEVNELKKLLRFIPALQNTFALGQLVKTLRVRDVDLFDTGIYAKIADNEEITGLWNFIQSLQTDANVEFESGTSVKGILDHANTAQRTYTFQDRDGVVADDTDLALKANLASPTFTGDPKAPTPLVGDNDTSIATTAFVTSAVATAVVTDHGALTGLADNDHPQYAFVASPTFTGIPAAPTAAPATNTTQIATTAFVVAELAAFTGSSNIVALGTIATGVWNGTAIEVTKGGTGLTSIAVGEILYGSASNVISKLASNSTATKKFLSETSDVPSWGALVSSDIPVGPIIQTAFTTLTAATTGTTTIPLDDTIPQNTEGDEYLTLAITPTSSTNLLEIEAVFSYSASVITNVIMALFQDSTANALAASWFTIDQGSGHIVHKLFHRMTAGTTGSTTFKIRIGPSAAATLTMNGYAGARRLGGVEKCYILIKERRA